MICPSCQFPTERLVRCACGESTCQGCMVHHICDAHESEPDLDPETPMPVFADFKEFTLRPYQQKALEAIIEELR